MKTATEHIPVVDAMHRGVVTCDVETPLSKVAQMMAGHRIHSVVVNAGEALGPQPWGVISDLDLTAAFAHDLIEDTTAGDIAATPALAVGKREPLGRAAQLMTEHAVTHLVVVDPGSGRPVGVLSTLDVAQAIAEG